MNKMLLADNQPGRDWWLDLFTILDAADADAFAGLFTEDGQFVFGNAPAIVGPAAIHTAVEGFWNSIAGSRHELAAYWTGPASGVVEGRVTYTRRDGSTLTVPFADVLEFRGGKVSRYAIYIDQAALYRN